MTVLTELGAHPAKLTLNRGKTGVVRELIQQGWAEQQAGRLSKAKSLYEQALRMEPRHPDALNLLGVIALQENNPQRAADLISRAIQAQPANPGFHANLAQALLASQRAAEACSAFRRAASLDPGNPQFEVGAAICLALQGSAAEAEGLLREVVRNHPAYPLGWYNLGNLLRDQLRYSEAAEIYQGAIRADPAFADAYNDLGRVFHLVHRFDEAEAAYRKRLSLDPDSAPGCVNLASLLIDRGRPADAIKLCREAIERLPGRAGTPDLHWMLGSALAQHGDLVSALTAYHAAVAAAPNHARALWGSGVALLHAGRAQQGLRRFARARESEPHLFEFSHGMAGVDLLLGNLQSGWRGYEQRPARARFGEKFPHVRLATEANGTLNAKTVLLVREQGLGDELFFLRLAPELKSRGAGITYCASAKIASILARVRALDSVITEPSPWPAADLVVLAGDLPRLLGRLDASPYHAPAVSAPSGDDSTTVGAEFPMLPRIFYPELPPPLALEALPEKLGEMRKRLSGLGSPPYVALTWRAGTIPEQQGADWMLHKEAPLERLGAAMRGVNGTLLALQRNPRPGEIQELSQRAARPVHDFTALNEDLEAMLALLALADEYIGVSNTNMHLRAGIGLPARVLVPRPAEWRWLALGDESPWFPTFRIYRQRTDGSWSAAFDGLARDLLARHGGGK
jgi:tetratricopeptide (TPR) repeat protein